jgi:hypothetical protein
MNLYVVQESLGVLLALATFMGALLVVGIAFILFQEGIRRAVRGAKTGVVPLKAVSAKEHWLATVHGRSAVR